ncbi:ASST-domain-containing protein [Aspergillus similis]
MARRFFWRCWSALVFVHLQAAGVRGDSVSTNYQRYNDGELGHRPHLEFQSSSEYAPLLHVNVWNPDAISPAGSHIFLRHDGNESSPLSSPLILAAHDLSAVYINRTFNNVFGTRIQENLGRKYLTFWAGDKGNGIGDGYGLAYDETYRLVYKVSAQNIDVHADLHEFAFTGAGTALVTGVDHIRVRGNVLSEKYGWHYVLPDELELDILDAVFQEIDLETNEVLFDWRALDHINPLDSFEPMGSGWDAYHINSIEKTQAGNYLISVRHTHSIHLIDGQTGSIIWTLGGRQNDFIEEPATTPGQPLLTLAWQHHARFVPDTNESQLTLFDNHVKVTTHGECRTNCSRGLHIAINTTATPPTAQLLQQFLHPTGLQAQSQGSVQPLAPSDSDLGSVFIGWGRCPTFTEHNSAGETVLDVQFSPWHSDDIPDALDNYRAYKMDWVATPWWDPAIAVRQGPNGTLAVYASWNGATEVASWAIRGANHSEGENANALVLATSQRTGFETRLEIAENEAHYRYLWAQALDAQGNILRSSEIVDLNTTGIPSDSYSSAFYEKLGLESLSSLQSVSSNGTQAKEPAAADTDSADASPSSPSSPSSRVHTRGLSAKALALLGTGAGVSALTLVAVVVVVIRRRRRLDYNSLSLKESDFELDLDGNDGEEELGAEIHEEGEADEDLEQSGMAGGKDEDTHTLLPKPG